MTAQVSPSPDPRIKAQSGQGMLSSHQRLSPREAEVLALVAQGKENKEIALALGMSTHTVKSFLVRISAKAGTGDRTALTVWGILSGQIAVKPKDMDTSLAPRQAEIAKLVAYGMSNEAIARQLGLSAATVKAHLAKAFRKLGISSREELAVIVLAREELARQQAS